MLHHLHRDRVEPLREVGLLEPLGRSPGPDRDPDRRPGRPQLAHDGQLALLERHEPLVAVEDEPGDPQHLVAGPPRGQRVEHRRQVDDQRGVAEVAEVDDAGDEAVVVGQHVVGRQVAVQRLRAQRRPAGGDDLVVPVEDGDHDPADLGVGDGVEHRSHARGVLHVPGQTANRVGVHEGSQRQTQPGGRLAPGDQGRVGQRAGVEPGPARQQVVGPHPVTAVRRSQRRDSEYVVRLAPAAGVAGATAGAGRRPAPGRPGRRAARRAPPCRASPGPRPGWTP